MTRLTSAKLLERVPASARPTDRPPASRAFTARWCSHPSACGEPAPGGRCRSSTTVVVHRAQRVVVQNMWLESVSQRSHLHETRCCGRLLMRRSHIFCGPPVGSVRRFSQASSLRRPSNTFLLLWPSLGRDRLGLVRFQPSSTRHVPNVAWGRPFGCRFQPNLGPSSARFGRMQPHFRDLGRIWSAFGFSEACSGRT